MRNRNDVQRQMVVSNDATPFGCCNFFELCNDEIFSLYYRGELPLLDWMGFDVSEDCYRVVEFINFVRPAEGCPPSGHLANPCDNPNGVEFGSCSLSIEDFGRYGRSGPTRDLFKPTKWCKRSPRYMLDGSAITSEADWDKMFAMDQMINDVRGDIITGNSATAGQFDGLQQWVNTGYDCAMLDSYVVNWNSNAMGGGNGITINGNAMANTFDIVDVLLDLHRNINERISWSPLLRGQARRVGDAIIVLPGFLARCLLDFYTCWSVCPELLNTLTDATRIVKEVGERRDFRIELNGGLFGNGRIFLDGHEIPLLQYDWSMINGPTTGDMYYLTGSIGSQRVWEGEHLDAQVVMRELAAAGSDGNAQGFFSSDNGRVLGKVRTEGTCRTMDLWMRPRLWCFAPWAQVRFQDVRCATPTGPLSPDPCETSFFPETSFSQAVCP